MGDCGNGFRDVGVGYDLVVHRFAAHVPHFQSCIWQDVPREHFIKMIGN